MDLKEMETAFGTILEAKLSENKDAITKEVTDKVREELEAKGMDFNKSDFPTKCVLNENSLTRKTAPFADISKEVNDFAEDVKSIIKAARAGATVSGSELLRSKALNETDDNDGGYLVPEEVGTQIIRFMEEKSVIRPRATVRSTSGNTYKMPKLNQSSSSFGGVALYWINESGSITESEPTFGQVTLKLNKLVGLTTITDELTQDNNVGLVNFVTTLFGEAMAYYEDTAFISGTGSGQPMGILTSEDCETVTRDTSSVVGIADLFDMDDKIPDQLSDGLIWLMRKTTYNKLRQLRSAVYNGSTTVNTGDYLIKQDITGKGFGTLLGYPIVITDKVSAYGSSGDVVLANLKGYAILDKRGGGISVATSTHTRFAYGETQMRFIKRVDGQPITDNAFVKLV